MADIPTSLDAIPWGDPPEETAHHLLAQPKPRRCGHPPQHRQTTYVLDDQQTRETVCTRCGHVFDQAKIRQGRTNSRRGKDGERRVAAVMEGRRVGQYGGASDVDALFAVQVKAGPSYWPRSLARLLTDHRLAAAALGRAGPAVAYVETGQHGRANRVIVAMYAEDLARALQGSAVPADAATLPPPEQQE